MRLARPHRAGGTAVQRTGTTPCRPDHAAHDEFFRNLLEPETTIQVQGTVTAADDGSPIAGASVQVSKFLSDQTTQVQTNNQGDYSLSFLDTGCSPERGLFFIWASADGFQLLFLGAGKTSVRCTEELQTIDFQLERETNAGTTWRRR